MTIRNIISEAFRRGKANKPDPFYQKMSDDAYEGAVKMHISMNSGPEYKGVTFTDKNRETMRKHRDAGAHPSKAFSAMMNEEHRPVHQIAREIRKEWGSKTHYAARPYLDAMHSLDSHKDSYGSDSGKSVIGYFLSNAASYRGPKAKAHKAELKAMLKEDTLGGPKYIGTENPNNHKSRMPGVFSPFKKAENQVRAEVAYNKHAVAATKAFVQRNMATLAKTTSAYAKRTKRHEQAMAAAEKVAPRDISKRGELMYESAETNTGNKPIFESEHIVIATRWGANKHAVKKWMKARKITSAMDFKTKYPGEWEESNKKAHDDFVNHVMNESVEDIHEISKALLGRYLHKSIDQTKDSSWRQGRRHAEHRAIRYDYNKLINDKKSAGEIKDTQTLTKRIKGQGMAIRKLTENEDIHEISKDMAQRYTKSATHAIGYHMMKTGKNDMLAADAKAKVKRPEFDGFSDKENETYHKKEAEYHADKASRRYKGIDRALKRLTRYHGYDKD